MRQKITVIGCGIAGLSTACFLAKEGKEVTIIEKNNTPGGRARAFSKSGFTYDMGPSWYWMPDVFERFFNHFGKSTANYYTLQRLNPSYQVIWDEDAYEIPADYNALCSLFEHIEIGAGKKLDQFLTQAAYKYEKSMHSLVYKPGLSALEYMRLDVIKSLFSIDMFTSMHRHVRRYFSNPKLLQLVEFPILFLGAMPQNTPALYSLMNHADMKLGTWYPKGGMTQIVKALHSLALSLGVQFQFGEAVQQISVSKKIANTVVTEKSQYKSDVVIAACDYHHFDQDLLQEDYRNYSSKYWDKRKMSPSCLLFYIGVNKRIYGLLHHNLFFDASFEQHASALYKHPEWPGKPLFYVCCPSKSDDSVAPEGYENLFILVPIAPGLQDNDALKERFYNLIMDRMEAKLQQNIRNSIVLKESYAYSNFVADYNAFKGNAYGLANTLTQTAFMKPSIRNKHLTNVYYTGQLTVPGPGLPPALISGEITASVVNKYLTSKSLSV